MPGTCLISSSQRPPPWGSFPHIPQSTSSFRGFPCPPQPFPVVSGALHPPNHRLAQSPILLSPFLWLQEQRVAHCHLQVCSEGKWEAIAMQGGINVHLQLAP